MLLASPPPAVNPRTAARVLKKTSSNQPIFRGVSLRPKHAFMDDCAFVFKTHVNNPTFR